MICIYCGEAKPKEGFSHTEHVIPQCLGGFRNNFVITEIVCDSCNQFFGDNIELHLGRDTLEGIARYRYGKSPKGSPFFKRLSFRVGNEPTLRGVHVAPIPPDKQTNRDEITIPPQVGFFNGNNQEYEYYELGEIPVKKEIEHRGIVINNKEIFFFGDTQALVEEMREKGYKIELSAIKTSDEKRTPSKIPVIIKARIDRTICRGIAKIAFNYLAYHLGPDILNRDDFTKIRRFIRYDEGVMDDFVIITKIPIFNRERLFKKRWHEGHIVEIGWIGYNLVGKAAIFNSIVKLTYIITLCKNYRGVWFPFNKGHFYDLRTKDIKEITNLKVLIY